MRKVDDVTCLLCAEKEFVNNLFFEFVVSEQAWEVISSVLGVGIGWCYELIAKRWLCKKIGVFNMITFACMRMHALVEGAADVEMLESSCAAENDGQL
jgi:hypothetical protein